MTTTTYLVKGMTCDHCVSTVSSQFRALDGVTDVAVELDTGEVTVTSVVSLATETVRAAIDEAGFELVS